MDEFKKRLVHLLHCKPLGWQAIFTLLEADSCLTTLYSSAFGKDLSPKLKFSSSILQKIPIESLLEYYQKNNIHLISIFDEDYPILLKNTYKPPWILFAKGDKEILKRTFPLAVVGSRDATAYGRATIDYLLPALIKQDAVIISGLARGIDAYAHKTAIRHGGKTIAVIAGGLEHIYPNENLELATKMMIEQLVISEYPPYTKPEKWQFPVRNRIISGLAKGTLIIEAKRRSGSFITADIALNEGREVFAVPGSILTPAYAGTNELIQLGAKLIKEPKDIIEEILK